MHDHSLRSEDRDFFLSRRALIRMNVKEEQRKLTEKKKKQKEKRMITFRKHLTPLEIESEDSDSF